MAIFLYYFFSALKKIPTWEAKQDLYRGIGRNVLKDFPGKYVENQHVVWYGCSSTTLKLDKIQNFFKGNDEGTIFTINGCMSGRSLKDFSAIPGEEEVLITPGAKFLVTSILEVSSTISMIQLAQVPTNEVELGFEEQ